MNQTEDYQTSSFGLRESTEHIQKNNKDKNVWGMNIFKEAKVKFKYENLYLRNDHIL